MTLVFPDQGERLALEYLVNKASPQDLVLRLFANDVTDGLTAAQIEALTESDFTEASFTGYSSKTLTGSSWSTSAGDPTVLEYAQQEFASSADQTAETIYGYYYTRATGGELVSFEYLDAEVTIENDGEIIRITPRITGRDRQD